jgi:hypothetical protein
MGTRYMTYRLNHELSVRLGLLKKKFPSENLKPKYFGPREVLFSAHFYFPKGGNKFKPMPQLADQNSISKIKAGYIRFFNAQWLELGLHDDWITTPVTQYTYPLEHWSEIKDLDPEIGDIKYVWEKSRFSWALPFIRADYHTGTDHSAFLFEQIDSWIRHNPVNKGPNYRCSQEMSLRLWNWSMIFNFYRDSAHFTEERWKVYQNVIYWHLHHIYHHIDFSRIAVRNNHAITETAMLFVSRWLFPFIPEVEQWSRDGERWLGAEINYQIYEDGTFLQFSMNYHRVVIQLLSAVISIAEINHYRLPDTILDRAYKSVNFLYQCMGNTEKGYLPNYGQNDGAWFFPWTSTDYRDYRPMLNALHRILTGQPLFEGAEVQEEWYWWGQVSLKQFPPIRQVQGMVAFPNGGYYLIRDQDTLLFFRNGNHKDRPAQADNQHLDLWYKGKNLLMDSGTYSYNTDQEWIKYFMGSSGHNCLQLGTEDQMLKGSRFIWYYWSQSKGVVLEDRPDCYFIKGTISAFRQMGQNIKIERTLIKFKGENRVEVYDNVLGLESDQTLIQNWHIQADSDLNISPLSPAESKRISGHHSLYYGIKEDHEVLQFISDSDHINVEITYG